MFKKIKTYMAEKQKEIETEEMLDNMYTDFKLTIGDGFRLGIGFFLSAVVLSIILLIIYFILGYSIHA
jgi:hypothetical protein